MFIDPDFDLSVLISTVANCFAEMELIQLKVYGFTFSLLDLELSVTAMSSLCDVMAFMWSGGLSDSVDYDDYD